jgi:LysM repeat protein
MRGKHARPSPAGRVAEQAARLTPALAIAGAMLGPVIHHQAPPVQGIELDGSVTQDGSAAPAGTTTTTASHQQARPRVYVVRPGDTLWGLAQRFYGSGWGWKTIWNANQDTVPDPGQITPGQQLTIPGTGSGQRPAATPDTGTATATQYKNPIGKGLIPSRVDQGVDYTGTGAVYALGDGTITNVRNSGWPGGTFIGLHLSDGPDAGKYVYYAEDINPAVGAGQSLTAGEMIGYATGSGIEVGWAAPPGTGQSMADHTGQTRAGLARGDAGYYPTAYGASFSDLIQSLGGPAGTVKGPVQGTVTTTTGDVHPLAQTASQLAGVPATAAQYIIQAAKALGLPAAVVAAQNYVESHYGTNDGPSTMGAMGPWQFEPYTWPSYSTAPFSQATSWPVSTLAYIAMMKQLLHWSGGNVQMALAAYNAGQGNWQAGLGYANTILAIAG